MNEREIIQTLLYLWNEGELWRRTEEGDGTDIVLTLRLCEKDGDEKKVEIKIPGGHKHPFVIGTIWNYLKYILAVLQAYPLTDEVRYLDKVPALAIHVN